VCHRCSAGLPILPGIATAGAQTIDPAALRTVTLRFTNARKLVTELYPSRFNDVIQPDPVPHNPAKGQFYG